MKAEEIEKIIEEGIRETNEIPYIAKLIHDAYEFQHPTPTLTDSMIEDIVENSVTKNYVDGKFYAMRVARVALKKARDFMQSGEALGAKEKKILLRAITWLTEDVEEGNERAIEIQAGLKDILNKSGYALGACMACGGYGYIDHPNNPCNCTGEAPQEYRYLTHEDDNLLERLDSCLAQVEMPLEVNNEYEAVRELISNRLSKAPQESKGDGIDLEKELDKYAEYVYANFMLSRSKGYDSLSPKGIKEYLSTRKGEGDNNQPLSN